MKKIKGFTLAEALLTMTILGVVAAFLIPTIVTDVREHANRA
ncbi:TPA: type II secretion system protein, partial [Candidatus Galligastranaerophilus gallistercoris]|nr:type II secretion system protein [Candidatus Galligastranaerophilus gallistercoris]